MADDHEVFRRGLRSLLESRADWEICGEASNGVEALEKTLQLKPDVVVLDINMPGLNGLETTRLIRQQLPTAEIVVVSQYEASVMAKTAAQAGARVYVAKSQVSRELLAAVEAAGRPFASGNAQAGRTLRETPIAQPTDTAVDESRPSIGGSTDIAALAPAMLRQFSADELAYRLAAIVESSDDAIVSKDLNGIVHSWNAAAQRIFGYTAEEMIGRSITTIIPPELLSEETLILSRIRAGQRIDHFDTVRMAKGGRRVNVSLTISPIKDAHGKIVGASKIARDITERKEKERELIEARQELERRVGERTAELQKAEQNLRRLSGRLLQMQDEERRRIARELHDSAGQMLVALDMSLYTIQQEAGKLSPSASSALSQSLETVQEMSRELRTISHLLHPPLLDEAGLPSAVRWYVEGFAERSKIAVDLDLGEELGRLPRELETTIFRIVQESLTNVHRHSGSATAAIRILRNSGDVLIEVLDQGKGIGESNRQANGPSRPGVGIQGMRERVRQLGGNFQILTPEKGTIVRATLPISARRIQAASSPKQ